MATSDILQRKMSSKHGRRNRRGRSETFCYPSRNAERSRGVSPIDMKRNTLFQTAALIVACLVLAFVVNAFASRDRKLALAGTYPNALKVPAREAATTTAPPVQPVTAVPTTTTAPAATETTATQPTATAAITTVGLNPAVKSPAATTTTTTAPTPHVTQLTPPSEDHFLPHPDKPYVEIALADVKTLHGRNVLFLDARRTSVYEQGHIAGARSYSVWESDID